jgi:hypothetical protein
MQLVHTPSEELFHERGVIPANSTALTDIENFALERLHCQLGTYRLTSCFNTGEIQTGVAQ